MGAAGTDKVRHLLATRWGRGGIDAPSPDSYCHAEEFGYGGSRSHDSESRYRPHR